MSVQLLGLWNEAELLLLEGSAVVSRDPTDGELRWRLPLNPATERAVLVADLLYKVDSFGKITAYVAPTDLYPDASDEEPFDMIWEIESGATGAPLLAALPAGGILAAFPDRQLAISDGGRVLWSEHEPGRPDQLINAAGRLYAAMPNGLVYEIAAAGMSPLGKALGDLYSVHDDLLIYALEGIYRLDLDGTRPAELLSPLPEGFRAGQIAALPGGGYAATHHQAGGDRLLVFNSGGGLRWERSLTNLPGSSTQLISGPLGAYMLTSDSRDESGQVRLYRIVPEEAALDLVFVAGSRRHLASADWISVLPQGQFLIAIGGGDLVRWDPAAALITVNEG